MFCFESHKTNQQNLVGNKTYSKEDKKCYASNDSVILKLSYS